MLDAPLMDFAYSPGRDAGGALHLSPTHIRHIVDSPMARTLRRSLSRSPSKTHLTRCSSPHRVPANTTADLQSAGNSHCPSPSPEEFQLPSAKKPRPSLRRTSPLSSISNGTPRHTVQRALSDTSDNGNSNPHSSAGNSGDGQENLFPSSPESPSEPLEERVEESPLPKAHMPTKSPRLGSRAPLFRPGQQEWRPAKSSPLKRSDAVMNLPLNPPGSPSAKRRTICGNIVSSPFGGFRGGRLDSNHSDREHTSSDEEIPTADVPTRSSLAPKTLNVRRSKSALKHGEKLSLSTRRGMDTWRDNARHSQSASRGASAQSTRGDCSSFGEEDTGANQELINSPKVQFARSSRSQPHPLSQTLSPTSPTPPGKEEHFPKNGLLFNNPSISSLDFAKSLPIGALRPSGKDTVPDQMDSQQSSFDSTFATPKPYHIAKPDPTAFRSTGLISKKHRNVDDIPPPPPGHPDMPDTPCKRFPGTFTFSTSPTPADSAVKEQRFSKPSFGTPRPFNPSGARPETVSFETSIDIFGSSFRKGHSPRRASIVSFDGDECPPSQCPTESQSSADDLPPTPTKQVLGATTTKPNSLRSSLLGRPALSPSTFVAPDSAESQPQLPASEPGCKSSPLAFDSVTDVANCESRISYGESAIPSRSQSHIVSVSVATTRLLRKHSRRLAAPTPPQVLPRKRSVRSIRAKKSTASVVFPPRRVSSGDRVTPHTPVDGIVPDPSGLSISPSWKQVVPGSAPVYGKVVSFPPATPTHRGGVLAANVNRPAMTPSNHVFGHDIDPVLSRKFKKVEWYGKGQFSEVYKVFEPRDLAGTQSYFASSVGSRSSQTPVLDQVYIVKKSKMPYTSALIRQRKLREAAVMSALGKSDHTVRLVNSWESSGHMYIQTEFCEEGSLEQFLAKAGNKGRLDDFRIWKILIELGEGLKHIHDCGFIHLDLKPANVFIDFAGVLKIGDFGLASKWPAPPDVEGEGDRRYIGPDLLQGSFDKPADIFALGMMMFEIAGNCELPDNGTYWQHLRSGNWSDLPSLTSASSYSTFHDDSSEDLINSRSLQHFGNDNSFEALFPNRSSDYAIGRTSQPKLLDDLNQPPRFMQDPADPEALEQIVHWMMQPKPADRPVVDQIVAAGGCRWVDERRRAGAVVFEGPWGPPSFVLAASQVVDHEDEEMVDAP